MSPLSRTATRSPRLATSRATPAPVAPIPTTSTSSSSAAAAASSVERLRTEKARLPISSSLSGVRDLERGEEAAERRVEPPALGQRDEGSRVARGGRQRVVELGEGQVPHDAADRRGD